MQTSEKFHSHHDDALESMADQDKQSSVENNEQNLDTDAAMELAQQELGKELLDNKVFAEGLYTSTSKMNQKLLSMFDKGAEQVLAKPFDMESRRVMIEKIETLDRQAKLAWYKFGKKTTEYAKLAILGIALGVGSDIAGIHISDFGSQETQKSVEMKQDSERVLSQKERENWQELYEITDKELLEEVYKKHPEVTHDDFKTLVFYEPKLIFHFFPEISKLNTSHKKIAESFVVDVLLKDDPITTLERLALLDDHNDYVIQLCDAALLKLVTKVEIFKKQLNESEEKSFSEDFLAVYNINDLVTQSNSGKIDRALLEILDTVRDRETLRASLQSLITTSSLFKPSMLSDLDKYASTAHTIWDARYLRMGMDHAAAVQVTQKAFQGNAMDTKSIFEVFQKMNDEHALSHARLNNSDDYVSYYGLPKTFLEKSLESEAFCSIVEQKGLSIDDTIKLSFNSWSHVIDSEHLDIGLGPYQTVTYSSEVEKEYTKAMQDIITAREVVKNIEVLNKNTTVIVMVHEGMPSIVGAESEMGQLLKYVGVPKEKQTLRQGMKLENGVNVNKKDVLGALRASKGDTTFIFDGHGSAEDWAFAKNESMNKSHIITEDENFISYKEIAKAIAESGNSQNISFIATACEATTYYHNVLNELQSTYDLQAESLPKVMISESSFNQNTISAELVDGKLSSTLLHNVISDKIRTPQHDEGVSVSVIVQDLLNAVKKSRYAESPNVFLDNETITVRGTMIQQKVKNPTPWMQVKGIVAHDEVTMNA